MSDVEDLHEHPRFDDRGLEGCPICGRRYSGNGLYVGPVRDADGNRWESVYKTDPEEGPYYCEDCYLAEIRPLDQHAIADFAGGESA